MSTDTSKDLATSVTTEQISRFEKDFNAEDKNLVMLNAMASNKIADVILSRKANQQFNHVFSDKLEVEGKATNQKASGRCWLFAGLNVMRLRLMQKYKLDDLELSQPYLFFYDKIEKSNWFLESIIELADKDLDDRTVQYLLKDPIQDGGQWDMFVSLVEKYGVVPKAVFPETFQTSNTVQVRWLLTCKLREYAQELRALHKSGKSIDEIRSAKEDMLSEVYRIMAITCGEPPKQFDWSFRNKDNKFQQFEGLTPLQFYKEHVEYKATETVSLINDPRNEYHKLYTVEYLGNVKGGVPVHYINLPIEEFKELAAKTLRKGKPVWFGCDVGKHFARQIGLLDMGSLDFELAFGVKFHLNKADRLRYRESLMTHAMMFTGVHVDAEEKTVRWRVANSWGEDTGDKGFLSMSDRWFDEFTYQIVLEKEDIPEKVLEVLKEEPVVLPPWDPMGSLA
ncbi:peptidase C1B, bleomycin hydrolase [Basidiobolus meristosporus CBS 931.73]|uniref:Cysteine proteinase 1, mitochondrial n=1 Tax=Basidiobolus meristosporus CBS 931.73 TaxID=1314790 RepID=A0A1Y1YNV5_9FUNG|nr:peptidase C1B, bleomycin hydrolase [Basidiobolus meristosporus CBS 931.73]|eukprot:ORX99707.1 peptidase C1B, bleomycin hydrolase [Basidiobolus meristosporus CBS 931.73]